MSRSIHTTRRSLRKLYQQKFPSAEAKAAALKNARQELRRKRSIKDQVSTERRGIHPPLAGTPICTIPIRVLDESPWVHHAASPDDIRAVLTALPGSATEGITRIQLNLGREYMDQQSQDEQATRDPFTGRLSLEVFPGVYGGGILGTYRFDSGVISVYAYVYDIARLPLPRPMCEVYLRLHALKTLVHEVAHHHDHLRRVARGRWLADRKPNSESYAEKMEHQWTQEVVLPYLQRSYPQEVTALCRWVAHRGGLMLPLDFFSGDGRRTQRSGPERFVFPTSSAFESWVEEVSRLPTLFLSRLEFARELNRAERHEECLVVLDRLLKSEPSNIPTLTCKTDTLVQLERLDEALASAETVLGLSPAQADAWESRGEVFELRRDWTGLLDNCARWEAAGKPRRPAQLAVLLHRAVAHCALGHESEMEVCLQVHRAVTNYRSEAVANRLSRVVRKWVYRRAGKPMPPAEAPKSSRSPSPIP